MIWLSRDGEAFARFVFKHFGGYWTDAENQRPLLPLERSIMKELPNHINERVCELAKEFEKKEKQK